MEDKRLELELAIFRDLYNSNKSESENMVVEWLLCKGDG